MAQRFPAYSLPPGFQTCFEPEGGFLAPEKCIAAHLRQAARAGAQLLTGTKVTGWRVLPEEAAGGSDGGGQGLVQVDTSAGSFQAKRLVLVAGGWMPTLVPELKASGGGSCLHGCQVSMLPPASLLLASQCMKLQAHCVPPPPLCSPC